MRFDGDDAVGFGAGCEELSELAGSGGEVKDAGVTGTGDLELCEEVVDGGGDVRGTVGVVGCCEGEAGDGVRVESGHCAGWW